MDVSASREGSTPEPKPEPLRKRPKARPAGVGKAGRKRKPRLGAVPVPPEPGEDATPIERLEWRLARIERAIAAQAARTERLAEKLDEVLRQDRVPRRMPTVVTQPGPAADGADST
jgi:hypothetical protein